MGEAASPYRFSLLSLKDMNLWGARWLGTGSLLPSPTKTIRQEVRNSAHTAQIGLPGIRPRHLSSCGSPLLPSRQRKEGASSEPLILELLGPAVSSLNLRGAGPEFLAHAVPSAFCPFSGASFSSIGFLINVNSSEEFLLF